MWEGRVLNPEKMEKTIIALNKNLEELRSELEEKGKYLKSLA